MKLESTDEIHEERDGRIRKDDVESKVFSLLPCKQTTHSLDDIITDLVVLHIHQVRDGN